MDVKIYVPKIVEIPDDEVDTLVKDIMEAFELESRDQVMVEDIVRLAMARDIVNDEGEWYIHPEFENVAVADVE